MATFRNLTFPIYITIAFSFYFYSCSVSVKKGYNGLIGANIYFFDTTVQNFVYAPGYWPEERIWFHDSAVIEELTGIHAEYNEHGMEKRRWVTINKYLFIDLRNKAFYEYTSFSDTVRFIRKYTQADSIGISGGWNFYYPRNSDTQSYQFISDTVINEILFKRVKLIQKSGLNITTGIGYLRCDKKGTMFQDDREFSTKVGCPLVRVDATSKKYGSLSHRIDFLRDSLTPEELKVFAAWERNAKLNPVK